MKENNKNTVQTNFDQCNMSREQFEQLDPLQKRQFFLQRKEYNSLFWRTLNAQIQVVGFVVAVLVFLFLQIK